MSKNKAPKRPPISKKTFGRVIKTIFKYYPAYSIIVLLCLITNAITNALPAVFIQRSVEVISRYWQSSNWEAAAPEVTTIAIQFAAVFIVGLIANFTWNRLMAIITQGTLMHLREEMFNHMQSLPISYFDSHYYGDIMSYYTNDIDTLRQMISQSLPQLIMTCLVILSVLFIMLTYSIWMTLIVLAGVIVLIFVSKFLAGSSARYFVAQQKSIADTEGYVEEIMNGEHVVQVFCHQDGVEKEFDEKNESLMHDSFKANMFANVLMPVLFNLGNLIYVFVAMAGGMFLMSSIPNLSLSGAAFSISIVVPFLNMTKQFTGQIGQISQQFNPIVMAMAGAERIYSLIDEPPESDEGYVELVNVLEGDENPFERDAKGQDVRWVWRHPHRNGEVTYSPVEGDVVFNSVDFGYTPEKIVLNQVSLFGHPGEKIAFVGATGAGKTTITNLINRFYDIADGKIRYDGININKIKKPDLRRSLGMVLQDVNLFTGTVLENIRYGNLEATDGECIEAAKLVGADTFIEHLPDGYDTMLTDNGSQLSQGQCQLISIARAAVADPPVMILDEATSSIDTRTEAIVQRGMDALMQGRTTFVIAHRLSTVRNADVIIVLDHGSIIERGTHDQLIEQKGVYYQLYTGAFELE